MGFGKMISKFIQSPEGQKIFKPVTKSTPMAVDVSADGMRKKSKALKGTTVSYSGIKTSRFINTEVYLTGAKTTLKRTQLNC
jgi:hypothetical protein